MTKHELQYVMTRAVNAATKTTARTHIKGIIDGTNEDYDPTKLTDEQCQAIMIEKCVALMAHATKNDLLSDADIDHAYGLTPSGLAS